MCSNSVRVGFRGGGCYARAGRLGPERWEAPRRCDCAALLAWPEDGLGCADTLHVRAQLHSGASSATRAVAEEAETKQLSKYESLSDRVDFRAVGLETLGAFGAGARALLDDIASRIDAHSGAINSRSRLYRRIAAAVQVGNGACVLEAHSRGLKAAS